MVLKLDKNVFLGGCNFMKYEVGMKLLIIHIVDDVVDYSGVVGTITHIDDIGQLHGTWGGLALIPELDDFIVLEAEHAQF